MALKTYFWKNWHVKITQHRSQNWPHHYSIPLDEYISIGIMKWYLSSAVQKYFL